MGRKTIFPMLEWPTRQDVGLSLRKKGCKQAPTVALHKSCYAIYANFFSI